MGFERETPHLPTGHHVELEERRRLVISGVEDVERFDEQTIVLTTTMGELEIQGEELHIETLSLNGGELKVDGEVHALIYGDGQRESGGFFARLFGA